MALTERFSHIQNTTLGVQGRIISGITDLTINDVLFLQTNTGPKRTGEIFLTVDGDNYVISFTLAEEAIDIRTIQGYTKQRNPDATGR
jgi:hypothetical protein